MSGRCVRRMGALASVFLACWLELVSAAAAKCGTLKILAVGDSITKGSIPSLNRNMPYLDFTKSKLQTTVGGCYDIRTSVAALGAAGVHVLSDGKSVIDYATPVLRSDKWDWVAIMVGTVDILLGGKSAAEIWNGGLKQLYDEALGRGSHIIGLVPLPNALVSDNDAGDQERRRLGDLIYAYSRQHPGKVRCLHWGVSWSGAQKGTYLEVDRLHMSPAGYHEMGDQVFRVIQVAMGRNPCQTCSRFLSDPAAPPPPGPTPTPAKKRP